MKRIGIATWTVAAVLALAGASVLADEGRGRPPAPPAESLQACQGLQDGAACSFTMGDRSVQGTCRNGPDGQPAACMPHRPHGPPPEAFQACQSLSEGAACSLDLHGTQLTGTCRKGPQGGGDLACAPPRPPHGQ